MTWVACIFGAMGPKTYTCYRFVLLGFLLLYQVVLPAQIDHWESVVLEGDTASYFIPDSQLDVSWRNIEFDDLAWEEGAIGIGYGDEDDRTLIDPTMSVYLRIPFEIIDIEEIDQVLLDMDFDDGFIAFINGIEVARSFMSGENPSFDQSSDGFHEAMLHQGLDPDRFQIDPNVLENGQNLLAIQVHNENINSSDLTALPFLSVGVNVESRRYREVPEWFNEPFVYEPIDFTSTHLPLVLIETNGGQAIVEEPKVEATMKIIYQGEDQMNELADTTDAANLDFDGDIRLNIRGSTSACCWPKKQYALTTYDAVGEKDNVSLLGMPSENDWILFAMAFDPTLIRDFTSYTLSRAIGNYASRGRFCEVFLNGEYQGLYVLQEKLKADDNRIDINRIEEDDIEGRALTGGYITKSDKEEGGEVAAWYMDNHSGWETAFIHAHPDGEQIQPQQNQYIREVFFDLETKARQQNSSFEDGYSSVIDVHSFIDFMIINELASNPDAYQFSTFFHKDRNGKLRAGPVWDFNLTYGNDLFSFGFDRSLTDVWQFDYQNVGAKFWRDLFEDEDFNCHFSRRWVELTQPGASLHEDQIHALIDDLVIELEEPIQREYARWNTEGNHDEHINEMKQWISTRQEWMTAQLGDGVGCAEAETPQLVISKIHYHPSSPTGENQKDLEFIEITNAGEQSVDLTGVHFGGTGLVYQFPANQLLSSGKSLILANETEAFRDYYGFSPYDEFSRSLNNGGQNITLRNGFGVVIDEVSYLDEAPWPEEADGQGYYLSLMDLDADNADATNWETLSQEELTVESLGYSEPVLDVFPNPVSDQVYITSERKINTIKLIGLDGRLLENKAVGDKQTQLNVSGFEPGIYLIDIYTESQHYSRKIVIQ